MMTTRCSPTGLIHTPWRITMAIVHLRCPGTDRTAPHQGPLMALCSHLGGEGGDSTLPSQGMHMALCSYRGRGPTLHHLGGLAHFPPPWPHKPGVMSRSPKAPARGGFHHPPSHSPLGTMGGAPPAIPSWQARRNPCPPCCLLPWSAGAQLKGRGAPPHSCRGDIAHIPPAGTTREGPTPPSSPPEGTVLYHPRGACRVGKPPRFPTKTGPPRGPQV